MQLTKKEHVPMETKLNTVEDECMRQPTHEEIELARKRAANPNILTGKDKLHAYCQSISYDDIFAE